jgi:hypothetical protein
MRKPIKIGLAALIALLIAVTQSYAAIYDDGNNEFIPEGIIYVPNEIPNASTLYPSTRIETESFLVWSLSTPAKYYYIDELFYGGLNKGRIWRIDVDWTNPNTPWYEFTYYGTTDSVMEMRYYDNAGTYEEVYQFNIDGTIKGMQIVDSGILIESSTYQYWYSPTYGTVTNAYKAKVTYDTLGAMTSREENRKEYDEVTVILRRDVDIRTDYDSATGRRTAFTKSDTQYDATGALSDVNFYAYQYDVGTGRLTGYLRTRIQYTSYGRVEYQWDTQYDAATGRMTSYTKTQVSYTNLGVIRTDYSWAYTYNPATGALTSYTSDRKIYDALGRVSREYYNSYDYSTFVTVSQRTVYYYYASGLIKSKSMSSPDAYGNLRYDYIDENFQGRGWGRLSGLVRADGSSEAFTEYWPGTEDIKTKEEYGTDGELDAIYVYDQAGYLLEMTSFRDDTDFMTGVNLAWINYGLDLGLAKEDGQHYGYSANSSQLYTEMAKWQGDYVRVFLFCDFRAGMEFAGDGTPTGFTDKVYEDMTMLLATARALDIKLIPTIFDYLLADGDSDPWHGEHPDLITDPVKRQALLDIFDDFIAVFGSDPSIYAWDVMNEPEMAPFFSGPSLPMGDVVDFVTDFADMIHTVAPGALVTVGSNNRNDMVTYWTGSSFDLCQFHYYDALEGMTPLDYPASNIPTTKTLFAGELEPGDVLGKLNTLARNGYDGGFFWQDNFYTIDAAEYDAIRNWFNGVYEQFEYHVSDNLYKKDYYEGYIGAFPHVSFIYYDENYYGNNVGRLNEEIQYDLQGTMTVRYVYRDYFTSTDHFQYKDEYDASNTLVATHEYDIDGNYVGTTTYGAMAMAQQEFDQILGVNQQIVDDQAALNGVGSTPYIGGSVPSYPDPFE